MPISKFCYHEELSAYVKGIVFTCLCLITGIINASKHCGRQPMPHACLIQSSRYLLNTYDVRHWGPCSDYHGSKCREGPGYFGIYILVRRQTLIE